VPSYIREVCIYTESIRILYSELYINCIRCILKPLKIFNL